MLCIYCLLREACSKSVSGFRGARFRGYYTEEEAFSAWEHAVVAGNTEPPDSLSPSFLPHPSSTDEEIYWVVVCGTAPGVYFGK